MEVWSAERVFARIASLAQSRPGGVVATDADGTLWGGDVGEEQFHAFLQHGRVEAPATEALRREARDHELSDAGGGLEIARRLYEAYLDGRFPEERICEVMTWCFAGWRRSEVRAFARAFVEGASLGARLHGESTELVVRARSAGISVVVVSASPFEVVAEAAARAGFEEGAVVAAHPRFDASGIMLPEVLRPIPYAGGKVARLRERVGSDRPIYAALGDNAFDVALLAAAAVGVAVRPKPRLRQRAGEVPGLVELAPQ